MQLIWLDIYHNLPNKYMCTYININWNFIDLKQWFSEITVEFPVILQMPKAVGH